MKVLWISTGVSSLVCAYLERKTIDKMIYCHIDDQEEDSLRFLRDCEKTLHIEVEILQSPYKNIENVAKAFGMIKINGACQGTKILKMRVRKEWEYAHKDEKITYVWGLDKNEQMRAYNLWTAMPKFYHEFPLIKNNLTKADAHAIIKELNIKRPRMYDLGYQNNNCIGCVKGGMGYWNKIRVDFPKVFEQRSKMEREIGYSILKDKGQPLFLDELDPTRGRYEDEIPQECGIACELQLGR